MPASPPRFTADTSASGGHIHSLPPCISPARSFTRRWSFGKKGGNSTLLGRIRRRSSASSPDTPTSHVQPSPLPSIKDPGQTTLEEEYGRRQHVIGHGAFGTVSTYTRTMATAATAFGSDAETEKLVAVKEFRRRASHTSWTAYSDLVRREFYLSKDLEHPNVIRTLQLYQGASQELYQVMEYCEAGDLFALVYSSRRGLHVEEADCFFKQLMCGVHYLHQNGIAHCDLKPENLLLTRQGCVKIADFGCAKDVRPATEDDDQEEETVLLVSGMCGSLPYISPEQHTKSSFDGQAADVWACGVIYLFVRFGTYLWGSATPDDDEYLAYSEGRRAEAGYRPLEMLEPPGCRNIVYCLLDPVPERRITAKQMLRSEWCSSIQVCNAGKGK